MVKVYLATYDDGDYYCESNHPIGVFSTRELAEEACADAKVNGVKVGSYTRHVYYTGIGEYELNEVVAE